MKGSVSPNTPRGTKIRKAIKLLELYPGIVPRSVSAQDLVLAGLT